MQKLDPDFETIVPTKFEEFHANSFREGFNRKKGQFYKGKVWGDLSVRDVAHIYSPEIEYARSFLNYH